MTITTRRVTGPIMLPDGSVPANGRVSVALTGPDAEGGTQVIMGPLVLPLDAGGAVDAVLWCTDTGSAGRVYTGALQWHDGTQTRSLSLRFDVPSGVGDLAFAPVWTGDLPESGQADALAQCIAAAASTAGDRAAVGTDRAAVEAARDEIVATAPVTFVTLQALAATPRTFAVGAVLVALKERVSFEVVDAADPLAMRTTAGGQGLKPLADKSGFVDLIQFGEVGADPDTNRATLQKWLNWGGLLTAGEVSLTINGGVFVNPAAAFTWVDAKQLILTATDGAGWVAPDLDGDGSPDTQGRRERAVILIEGADNVKIDGVEIVLDSQTDGFGTCGFMAHTVTDFHLRRCKTSCSAAHVTSGVHTAPFEVQGNCSGWSVKECKFDIPSGGGIMIFAFAGDNANFEIAHNKITKSGSADEIIACLGVEHVVRNGCIHHNHFTFAHTEINVVASAFSSASTGIATAGAQDIYFSDNVWRVDGPISDGYNAFRVGRPNTAGLLLDDNLSFERETVVYSGALTARGVLFGCAVGVTNGALRDVKVVFETTDTDDVEGTPNPIETLIYGAWADVRGVTGDIYATQIFKLASNVGHNSIRNLGAAGRLATNACDLTGGVYQFESGVRLFDAAADDRIRLHNVAMTCTGAGEFYQHTVSGGGTPAIDLQDCQINLAAVKTRIFNAPVYASGISKMRMVDCVFTGSEPTSWASSGSTLLNPTFGECRGNNFMGVMDNLATAVPALSRRTLYPLGHQINNAAPTPSGGTVTTGWIKVSASDPPSNADWYAISATANVVA